MLAVSAQLPRPCRLAVIAGVLLATFATLAPAEIYQWKDENGKTVFSERPPADGKASVVKPKTGKANSNAQEKLRQDRERIGAQLEPLSDEPRVGCVHHGAVRRPQPHRHDGIDQQSLCDQGIELRQSHRPLQVGRLKQRFDR